jgi:glycosyltransferase involved in cell wall biosynthesis
MVDAIATGAQGPQGPGLRVRLMIPAPHLRAGDVNLIAMPLFTSREADMVHTGSTASRVRTALAARRRFRRALGDVDADVVVVQRQVDPLPGRGLERAGMRGRALIQDVDDSGWLPEPGSHPATRLRRNAEKLKWLAAQADRVIAGNDYLADWLSPHARDITVVPSLVDTDKVTPRVHHDSQELVLGWIGSSSTAQYLRAVTAPLAAFVASHPELTVKLLTVGGPAPAIAGVRSEHWRWSEAHESAALEQMDIGLMPLPDNAWTRGKCAYKALQYMAAGVPVLADDVGITAQVVGTSEAGIVAGTTVDWQRALDRLAAHAGLRQRMGVTGRARVEEDFSVRAWGPRLASLIAGTV